MGLLDPVTRTDGIHYERYGRWVSLQIRLGELADDHQVVATTLIGLGSTAIVGLGATGAVLAGSESFATEGMNTAFALGGIILAGIGLTAIVGGIRNLRELWQNRNNPETPRQQG